MCLSQLSLSGVTGSAKNLAAQLVSRLSLLVRIMVQGRTNVGQLVPQLSLSENVVQGELHVLGLHRVFSFVKSQANKQVILLSIYSQGPIL